MSEKSFTCLTNEECAVLPGSITVQQTVSQELICDMFVGAFEGGSNYWLRQAGQIAGVAPSDKGVVWWGSKNIYEPSLKVKFIIDEEEDNVIEVTWNDIIRGAQLMAEHSPQHFADMINENHDATTADVFMQYVVLKGIIYG